MPSLKSIRKRIASVKNTQKITKAMKMVATAKLRRAQDAVKAIRPYASHLGAILGRRCVGKLSAACETEGNLQRVSGWCFVQCGMSLCRGSSGSSGKVVKSLIYLQRNLLWLQQYLAMRPT